MKKIKGLKIAILAGALMIGLGSSTSAMAVNRQQAKAQVVKAAEAINLKKQRGNMDKYIGLKSYEYVVATAKVKLYVYNKPNKESGRIGSFTKNNCIIVAKDKLEQGVRYNWLPVQMTNGRIGYISKNGASLDIINHSNFGLSKESSADRTRIKVCRYGFKYMGTKFVLGGRSMTRGIDCSTFARTIFRHYGVMVGSRATANMLSNTGKKISRSQLMPGDMVFYYNSSSDRRIGHCAIYLGKGYIINASGHQGHTYPSGGIRISKIDYRYPTAVKFRNIVGNQATPIDISLVAE